MLLDNTPKGEAKKILRESSYKQEVRTYERKLTQDEVNMRQKQYFQTDESLERELEALSEIKKEFKERTDQFKDEKKHLARSIRFKSESITGTCYDIVNFNDGMMETYDGEGIFIESRPLLPSERQQKLPFEDGSKLTIAM